MRRPVRLALSVFVALGAGSGLAVAQEVLRAETPPEIVTDLDGPLFMLQAMTPGAAPVQRCVTVYPRGGRADDVFLSADVRGALAARLRQDVTAGRAADGVRASRACDGFVPDRTLWSGSLDSFPGGTAPLQDSAPLAPGEPRVYRFRAWLDDGAAVPLDWLAEQDLQWRAELDPDAPPPATSTTVVTQTQTQTQTQTVTTPAAGQVARTPAPPAARDCVAQPGERPTRVFSIDGRRVALIVGPTRRLQPGQPLALRVRDPGGVVHRATYEIDGRRIVATGTRPWRAALPLGMLRDGASRVTVRLETEGGKLRWGSVELRSRPCPPIVRATSFDPAPSSIVIDLDPGVDVGRIGLTLPRGVHVAATAATATGGGGQRLRASHRAGRVWVGALAAGTAARLRIRVAPGSRPALAVARCARSEIVVRLEPLGAPARYVRVPLMGRGGGCRG